QVKNTSKSLWSRMRVASQLQTSPEPVAEPSISKQPVADQTAPRPEMKPSVILHAFRNVIPAAVPMAVTKVIADPAKGSASVLTPSAAVSATADFSVPTVARPIVNDFYSPLPDKLSDLPAFSELNDAEEHATDTADNSPPNDSSVPNLPDQETLKEIDPARNSFATNGIVQVDAESLGTDQSVVQPIATFTSDGDGLIPQVAMESLSVLDASAAAIAESVNDAADLDDPVFVPLPVPPLPQSVPNDPATQFLNETSGLAVEVPAESAPSESLVQTETVRSEPSVLAVSEARRLLNRARLELAAGDIRSAHSFAEAAAEIAIPMEVFEQKPNEVLDEIEFVTSHNHTLTTAAFTQAVPPAPAPSVGGGADGQVDGETADEAAPRPQVTESSNDDPQGFRAISRTSLSIRPKLVDADGERRLLPERRAHQRFSQVPTVYQSVGYSREWAPLPYSWEAPGLKYNPLYFEDAQLERYGNEVCILQPFLSGARFYATLPTLPYQMMSEGNSLCHTVYDLGYDRPGNCVPYAVEVPPFSWTGSLASGGWAYALIVILP
ncbi:MAG: hypothetical protein O3B86_18845, partial [Planctomycetota bacterium]|nr:hypothetical protein [Planctomycetota bacterium]